MTPFALAVAVHFGVYNFVRKHHSLQTMPAEATTDDTTQNENVARHFFKSLNRNDGFAND